MAKNVFFNFIKFHIENQTNPISKKINLLIKGGVPQLKTNKESIPYYLLELPKKNYSFQDGKKTYRLIDHHLSIYSRQRNDIASLSQYHYTAHFKDERDEEYTLHLYFDENNQLLKISFIQISLTPKKTKKSSGKAEEVASLDTNQFKEEFSHLAQISSEELVSTLRREANNKLKEFILKFNKLEKETSSVSQDFFQANEPEGYENCKARYLKNIVMLRWILAEIIPLAKCDTYQKSNIFLRRLEEKLRETQFIPSLTSELRTEDHSFATAQEIPTETTYVKRLKGKEKTSTVLNDFDNEVEQLALHWDNWKAQGQNASLYELSELLAKTYELFLMLDEPRTKSSLNNIQRLHEFHQEIRSAGEKLFLKTMQKKSKSDQQSLKSLEPLKAFHYLLDSERLTEALRERNAPLMDFILSYGDPSLKSQPIRMQGKQYNSPLLAAYYCDTETAPMLRCFEVCIQHKIPLGFAKDGGLPLAYLIFSNPQHPLISALPQDLEFYQNLVRDLRLYLKSKTLKKEEIASIELAIDSYQRDIVSLTNVVFSTKQGLVLQQKQGDINKKIASYRSRLKKYPEVLNIIKRLEKANREYCNRLTTRGHAILRKNRSKKLDEYSLVKLESFNALAERNEERFTFIKNLIIELLRFQAENLELHCELFDLMTLRQTSKNKIASQNRRNEIIDELVSLKERERARTEEAFDTDPQLKEELKPFLDASANQWEQSEEGQRVNAEIERAIKTAEALKKIQASLELARESFSTAKNLISTALIQQGLFANKTELPTSYKSLGEYLGNTLSDNEESEEFSPLESPKKDEGEALMPSLTDNDQTGESLLVSSLSDNVESSDACLTDNEGCEATMIPPLLDNNDQEESANSFSM